MRATSRAQPISRSQRRLDAAVVRIAIRFIVVVVIVHLISTRCGWVTQRRWRHKLSFHAAARRTRRTGSLRRWLHHRRDVLLDFFALETRVSRGKVMRVAVFTVPISRARTVRDGRRVGVRRVTGSQVGRRRWTFRHLRLRNGASWRTARRGGFRRRRAFRNNRRGGLRDGCPTRRSWRGRRRWRSSRSRQTSSRRRWTSRRSLWLLLLLLASYQR